MICQVLSFVGPCFVYTTREFGETCTSKCSSAGQSLPSYSAVLASHDKIMKIEKPLSPNGAAFAGVSKVGARFPIDVAYDFDRADWIEPRSGVSVQLPWEAGHPYLNHLLVNGYVQNKHGQLKVQV